MKAINFLLDKIIAPLMVALLTPVIIGIASKITTGGWMNWFSLIPKTVWIIFALCIFILIIFIVIYKRVKYLKKSNADPIILLAGPPTYGWINLGKLKYAGVIWRIRAPAPSPWKTLRPLNISPSSIEVETPPRCPNCETELEESRNFWGGFTWKCVNCGFQKRNRNSFYKEMNRVKKIARQKWEKELEKYGFGA